MSTPEHTTGPHLVVAALCERVLQEQDGVLSAIRLIDQVTQSAAGPDIPEQMPPFLADSLTMLICLKADQARGRFGIRIRPEAPGGFQLPPIEQAIQLSGGPGGVNLVMPLVLPIDREGVYWFEVFLTGPPPQSDRLLTRVPLEVVYAPRRIGESPAES